VIVGWRSEMLKLCVKATFGPFTIALSLIFPGNGFQPLIT
jgi:hypothetical protein